MNSGTATLNFGAFPGASDAAVNVTGQGGILAGSLVEAWLFPAATADHTADEHIAETIAVRAGNIIPGTGFTIYGWNTNQVNEPLPDETTLTRMWPGSASTATPNGSGTLLYGAWNVAWVWN